MGHLLYCLECGRVVGESAEGGELDRGQGFYVCQSCAQHARPRGRTGALSIGPIAPLHPAFAASGRLDGHRPDAR